jgi:hypothetical protein
MVVLMLNCRRGAFGPWGWLYVWSIVYLSAFFVKILQVGVLTVLKGVMEVII